MPSDDKPVILSSRVLFPIGAAVAIVGCAISATMWMEGRLNGLERGIERANYSIERVSERMDGMQSILADRVTFGTFQTWTELLEAQNPAVKVPKPRK